MEISQLPAFHSVVVTHGDSGCAVKMVIPCPRLHEEDADIFRDMRGGSDTCLRIKTNTCMFVVSREEGTLVATMTPFGARTAISKLVMTDSCDRDRVLDAMAGYML